jgi:phosphotransferase system, enzyme I, PtsP
VGKNLALTLLKGHYRIRQDIRVLLKQLRDIMASPKSLDEKLDHIVRQIALGLAYDVCSLYLMRAGDVLELYATYGLNREAIHQTRLIVGQGLVGRIAANAVSLAVQDAQNHVDFVYKPETGEEIYNSLLGIPLLKDDKVIGVLVTQNHESRLYDEDEIEILETMGMVIAELMSRYDIISPSVFSALAGFANPQRLDVSMISPGLAVGQVILHTPKITVTTTISDDSEYEKKRLEKGLNHIVFSIEKWINDNLSLHEEEAISILEMYKILSKDPGWIQKVEENIETGLTAEAALLKVQNELRYRIRKIDNSFFQERLKEFEDITNRLLLYLTNQEKGQHQDLPPNAILFAKSLTPAELLSYDRSKIKAIVLCHISPTSHIAILAKTFNMPIVRCVDHVLSLVDSLDTVVVDADNGQVFLKPSENLIHMFQHILQTREKQKLVFESYKHRLAITQDQQHVSIMMNAGLLADLVNFEEMGAEGVGLYRTELPFMMHPHFPTLAQQVKVYKRALDYAQGKPVFFRTLDIGGDKVLPYIKPPHQEPNPALGWRGMRVLTDRPGILKKQLSALIRAADGQDLWVMFPMISEAWELDKALELFYHELDVAKQKKQSQPRSVKVGIMLEVPALFLELPKILKKIDFISLGSNDFFQFFYACDRLSESMSARYDFLSPSMLKFCKKLVNTCKAENVLLSICGETASQPLEAITLAGLGFRNFSMIPSHIGPIKAMFLGCNLNEFENFLTPLLESEQRNFREHIKHYMIDHHIPMNLT